MSEYKDFKEKQRGRGSVKTRKEYSKGGEVKKLEEVEEE